MPRALRKLLFPVMWLQLFATQVTTQESLSPEMKTFYDMTLIDEAQPQLVHDQFGQKRPIPKGGGKVIEFRKFAPLQKALTALTEGVTPAGNSLTVTAVTAEVAQYGDYITQSDVLELTALDNTILEATKLLGRQAGLTLDTVVRNVLQAGTNVSYASKWNGDTEVAVESRKDLDNTSLLKVDTVNQIVAKLRAVNAPTIDGYYIGILHPYAAYDLMSDPAWVDAHKYAEPGNIYEGEIGKIGGVRFVQTTEAKVFAGEPLTALARNLTVRSNVSSNATIPVKEAITADDVTAFAARDAADKKVWIAGNQYNVTALVAGNAGSASMTLSAAASVSANAVIAPVGGTADGLSVFGTLIFGAGAYGVTEIQGGGLETIVKQKGSAGTADPLNQRSSVGWKALKTAKILIPDYLVRCESVSSRFSMVAQAN